MLIYQQAKAIDNVRNMKIYILHGDIIVKNELRRKIRGKCCSLSSTKPYQRLLANENVVFKSHLEF